MKKIEVIRALVEAIEDLRPTGLLESDAMEEALDHAVNKLGESGYLGLCNEEN